MRPAWNGWDGCRASRSPSVRRHGAVESGMSGRGRTFHDDPRPPVGERLADLLVAAAHARALRGKLRAVAVGQGQRFLDRQRARRRSRGGAQNDTERAGQHDGSGYPRYCRGHSTNRSISSNPGSGRVLASNVTRRDTCRVPAHRASGASRTGAPGDDRGQTAAIRQLIGKRRSYLGHRSTQQNGVVGRLVRIAPLQRPVDDNHVVDIRVREVAARRLRQAGIAFQRHDRGAEPRKNGARIAGAATDIEDDVARPRGEQLHEPGEDHRFHHEAPAFQRQVFVDIRDRRKTVGNEAFPGNLQQGRDQGGIVHPVGTQLAVDHGPPLGGELGHPASSGSSRDRGIPALPSSYTNSSLATQRPLRRSPSSPNGVKGRRHAPARWESGYPADCKSVHSGSNPLRASSAPRDRSCSHSTVRVL